MKIKCIKCNKEQQSDEYFLRFLPKGVSRPIYICEVCEIELGGKSAAENWVTDIFVKRTKQLDE